MPVSVQIALPLAVVTMLLVLMLPPTADYFRLLGNETLPRLREPANAKKLRAGIPLWQWTRDWVPLDSTQRHRQLSVKGDQKAVRQNGALLTLGHRWFTLIGLLNSWALVLVLSLSAYLAARLGSRTLSSPALPLIAALVFVFLSLPLGLSARASLTGEEILSGGDLSAFIWRAPLAIFMGALLASFFPFRGADPQPTAYRRFFILLRDVSFFSLTLLAVLFLFNSWRIQQLAAAQ